MANDDSFVLLSASLNWNIDTGGPSQHVDSHVENTNIGTGGPGRRVVTSAPNAFSGTQVDALTPRDGTPVQNAFSGTQVDDLATRGGTPVQNAFSGAEINALPPRVVMPAHNAFSSSGFSAVPTQNFNEPVWNANSNVGTNTTQYTGDNNFAVSPNTFVNALQSYIQTLCYDNVGARRDNISSDNAALGQNYNYLQRDGLVDLQQPVVDQSQSNDMFQSQGLESRIITGNVAPNERSTHVYSSLSNDHNQTQSFRANYPLPHRELQPVSESQYQYSEQRPSTAPMICSVSDVPASLQARYANIINNANGLRRAARETLVPLIGPTPLTQPLIPVTIAKKVTNPSNKRNEASYERSFDDNVMHTELEADSARGMIWPQKDEEVTVQVRKANKNDVPARKKNIGGSGIKMISTNKKSYNSKKTTSGATPGKRKDKERVTGGKKMSNLAKMHLPLDSESGESGSKNR